MNLISDWRFLAGFTILSWGSYAVLLKAIANRMPWQLSMLLFVSGYAAIVAIYCLLNMNSLSNVNIIKATSLFALGAGVLCGLGAITFFKAIPLVPGSILMPLTGLYVLIAALGCLIILKEPVSLRVIVGIIFAVTAVILLGK